MNSGLPMVSIMMNCYNGEKYLREAIDSVFAQTYDAWEIVFWDNQSTDGSSDIVKSYDSEKIKYIYAPEHTSLYKARNLALEFCTCEYVAFLDCDDLWEPQKLEKQIAVFEGDNNIVLVHSNTVFFNSDNGYSRVANIEVMPSGSIFKSLVEKYRVSLETVVVRRDTLVKHCLNFGDSYNMIGDRDLFTLLSYYGKVQYIPDVLGAWRIHSNNFSKFLHETFPSELKTMYLRLKKKCGLDFTKEMRLSLYGEIKMREALNLIHISGAKARKKLRKVKLLNLKTFVFFVITFLPYSLFSKIINYVKNS